MKSVKAYGKKFSGNGFHSIYLSFKSNQFLRLYEALEIRLYIFRWWFSSNGDLQTQDEDSTLMPFPFLQGNAWKDHGWQAPNDRYCITYLGMTFHPVTSTIWSGWVILVLQPICSCCSVVYLHHVFALIIREIPKQILTTSFLFFTYHASRQACSVRRYMATIDLYRLWIFQL